MKKTEILTIPNFISFFRLIMIPIYIVLYLNAESFGQYALAAAVLAFSCLTDMVDGKIARKFHMVSKLGIVLDPIADKATQGSVLICIAIEYPIVWSLLALFAVKEAFQFTAGFLFYRKGKMMQGALISGKVCTAVLFVSLIALILFHDSLSPLCVGIVTAVDGAFMLNAFINYLIAYSKQVPLIRDIRE